MEKTKKSDPKPPSEYRYIPLNEDVAPPLPPATPDLNLFGSEKFYKKVDEVPENDDALRQYIDETKPPLQELKKINHKMLFKFKDLIGQLKDGEEMVNSHLDELGYMYMAAHRLLHKLRSAQSLEHQLFHLKSQKSNLDDFQENFKDLVEKQILDIDAPRPDD